MTNKDDNSGDDTKGFDYDSLVEESLKNVVKKVLKITSETGLIGESHFFITFNGNDPDVIIPSDLKSDDNSEVKIIIQHQFWKLKTTNDYFEVILSFNGKRKNIVVPFKSIISFTDPSVGFGLQFKVDNQLKLLSDDNNKQNMEPKDLNSETDKVMKSGEVVSLDEFRDKK